MQLSIDELFTLENALLLFNADLRIDLYNSKITPENFFEITNKNKLLLEKVHRQLEVQTRKF